MEIYKLPEIQTVQVGIGTIMVDVALRIVSDNPDIR